MTLRGALDSEPDLRNLYEADAKVRELFDSAMKLEGLARHTGVHAAGVIIAQQPLEDIVPLYRQADREDPITQWDGPTCDKAGLMKVDFLGLQTLTIVHRAGQLVGRRHGRVIDPAKLPLDDQEVYELFRAGRTDGVFQFESDGMKAVLMQMRPTRIEDLIAANAMYRPGPMELIPTYCARKHGQEPAPSVHPLVDDMLAETYGIMCYQEQVMQVLNRLGQLPLNRALSLIRAVSKKKQDVIAAERQNFVQGALANGIEQADANRLFELIQRFAGYGFNKAHSTSYAILAYQTAYFKVHYPQEFIAATLTLESGDIDKVVQYIAEAARMGIKVARPDVNTCSSEFTVDDQGVRFGLAAVKGVGEKAVEAMLAARQQAGRFRDLFHFCQHVDLRAVNRATIEALVKCGAFDSLGASRAAMVAALDQAIELGQAAAADRRSGQMSFFAALGQADQDAPPRFPDVEPWSEAQLLAAEKETLGFYITSHPLTPYARELAALGSPAGVQLARLEDYPAQARVVVGCMVAQVRPMLAKSGRSAGAKMAMLTLEDLSGKADAVLFANNYASYAPLLEPERIVFVAGTVDRRRERPCILVDHVIPADQALEQLTGLVMLRLPPLAVESAVLPRLHDVLVRHRGDCPILLELRAESRHDVRVTLRPNACWSVKPCRGLVEELTGLLGQENVVLRPARREPNGRNGSRRPPAPGQGALIPSALPRAGEGEDAAPATAGPP
jgi:DNA polymerase-3 subunit alpha